ncbi:MAG: TlpA family protein disulfide reductase, partial [Planctomycetales bacterium]|nr:TlpA family protein disulfide reductase [Planctomycetales bacterium]
DFWATWCGPCVAALPIVNKVASDYAEKGVVFYAVNQQEEAEQVTSFLAKKELDLPVAMDPEGEAGAMYLVEGLPTSVMIGLDGRVQVVHMGYSPAMEESLREELDALVAKKDLASAEIAKWNEEHPDKQVEVGGAGEGEGQQE